MMPRQPGPLLPGSQAEVRPEKILLPNLSPFISSPPSENLIAFSLTTPNPVVHIMSLHFFQQLQDS